MDGINNGSMQHRYAENGNVLAPSGLSDVKSPFQKKKSSKFLDLEKWFPVGSKGRDTTQKKMVAQKIKTIDFDVDVPIG